MKDKKIKELKNLGKTLRELRESYHYTQGYVAGELLVTYQAYQAYELGKNIPSLENFIKLADLYDVSLDALLGRKDI